MITKPITLVREDFANQIVDLCMSLIKSDMKMSLKLNQKVRWSLNNGDFC